MPEAAAAGSLDAMTWWETPDVTQWRELQEEVRGKRAKVWVADGAGVAWLRKSPRDSRPFEPAIEALTLELAKRFNFEVAHGRACTWSGTDGVSRRGFASRRFHDHTEEQHSGGALVEPILGMAFSTTSEEIAGRPKVTLDVVRRALVQQQLQFGIDLVRPFLRVLVFDAWIGNGDRHSGNWAILVRGDGVMPARCRLAPMYDTAGCLGSELQDNQVRTLLSRSPSGITEYARRCRTGFGDGGSDPGILQTSLMTALRSWPEWDEVGTQQIHHLCDQLAIADDVLADIPDDWLPPPRKELVRALLEARARLLRGDR